jgi:hypothetical protein
MDAMLMAHKKISTIKDACECSRDSVFRRQRVLIKKGLLEKRKQDYSERAPIEKMSNKTASYLGWIQAGCPEDIKQNENLSSVGGQLGCEVYTRCNSVGRGAAE